MLNNSKRKGTKNITQAVSVFKNPGSQPVNMEDQGEHRNNEKKVQQQNILRLAKNSRSEKL